MGSPYVVPVLATALLSVAAGAFVRARARHEPTTREFVIDCAALALACAAYAAELASPTLEAKIVWLDVRYVGICAVPLTSLRLALRWAGHDAWLAPKRFVPIAAIPAVTLVLAWTDPWHHLIASPHTLVLRDGYGMRTAEAGPAFWVFALYAYALLVVVCGLYARALFGPSLRRRQGAILLVATLVPWASNFAFLAGVVPDPLLDVSSFGFAASATLLALGLLHGRLFDLAPVARDVVFESFADAAVVVDADGRVVDWNRAAQVLFGRSDALGSTLASLAGAEIADRVVHQQVDDLSLFGRMFEVRAADVRAGARLVTLRDVSEQRAGQAARDAALAVERSATAARDAFLARMGHEVRGPLHGVLGAADLLLSTELAPAQRRYGEAIAASAGSLLALADEILDHARLDADRIEIELDDVPADAALDEIVRMFGAASERKGVRVAAEVDAGLAFRADANRLRQVLVNLVANALRFTDAGAITLRARRDGDRARLEVTDTGVGIPLHAHARIFEPFHVAATARDGRSGTGLGLSIVRRLVGHMGGTIELESAPGAGTTFRIALPAASARVEREAPAGTARGATARGARVLVVDDHEISRLVTQGMLEREGCVVEQATGLADARARLAACAPELVITDLRMPDGDGLELVASLRGTPVPVIVLTGDVYDGARDAALAAGAAEWLGKPLDAARLREVLERVIGLTGTSDALDPAARARVLIAFVRSAPGEIDRIEALVRDGRTELARAHAHALRGAASMIGATEIAAACAAIESSPDDPGHGALSAAVERLAAVEALAVVERLAAAQGLAATHADPAERARPAEALDAVG